MRLAAGARRVGAVPEGAVRADRVVRLRALVDLREGAAPLVGQDKPVPARLARAIDLPARCAGRRDCVAVSSLNWPNHDEKLFVFSFESHGRCSTPQKFEVKAFKKSFGAVKYRERDFDGHFVEFSAGAAGGFSLGNQQSKTFCDDLDDCFENIKKDTLTGKRNREKFTCVRLVALQLH